MSGGGQPLDPPPGRDVVGSPNHTFRQFAELTNAAFARWDLGHLWAFRMADGSEIGFSDEDNEVRDAARAEMPRREVGERFEFDFGDSWVHRCAVLEARVDPLDVDGARPRGPVAVWVGSIPDRYGRTTPEG